MSLVKKNSAAPLLLAPADGSVSRPLRTNYDVTHTGFITDIKKGFKKAVDEGKKMYKEGKEMYKQYKKSKEKKSEK